MTALTKPVRRMSETVIRDGGKRRRLVITLCGNDTISLRPEKTRREETITLDAVYALAVRQRVASERRERISMKKEAQRARSH